MVLSPDSDSLTSLYLMSLLLTSYLQQIVNYSYIVCIIVTTYPDCLRRTTKNTLITTEITRPITAITNSVTKMMFIPLSSSELSSDREVSSLLLSYELPSLALSFKHPRVTIEYNRTFKLLSLQSSYHIRRRKFQWAYLSCMLQFQTKTIMKHESSLLKWYISTAWL